MLRNRSRAVIGKQSLVADHHRSSQSSPTRNHRRSRVSSFFGSAFGGLSSPSGFCSDPTKPMMNPALILNVNPFSALRAGLPDQFPGGKKRSWEDIESRGIGLAIVDKFEKMPDRKHPTSNSNLVLFGSAMRVRIPPSPAPALEHPESPTDFGIKTRNSHLSSPNSRTRSSNSPRILTECLSMSEMELSEDYTCVTYHGPNARTTHIFDNCIVENYYSSVLPDEPKPVQPSFLSFCYTCKKSLEQTKDIYIYSMTQLGIAPIAGDQTG
ncbi:hypothetical protein CRG98_023061 [Punica granatum]|uniref:FLZ-type domain-containing protein n=1 Tax=Punica granatum TaxID=22663 RepID=A0A2I0JJT5_PUNGR|nr:hypothetical protein CRG98_023061 [Punica granatum]